MAMVILAAFSLPSYGRFGKPPVLVKRFECRLVHGKGRVHTGKQKVRKAGKQGGILLVLSIWTSRQMTGWSFYGITAATDY